MSDDPERSDRIHTFMEAQKPEQPSDPVQPEEYAFTPSRYPSIPTASERKKLQNDRPDLSPTPSPDGWNPPNVTDEQRQDIADREERIRYLVDRLNQEKEIIKTDFDKAIESEI